MSDVTYATLISSPYTNLFSTTIDGLQSNYKTEIDEGTKIIMNEVLCIKHWPHFDNP